METLARIFLDHKVGFATYISKDTTEVDLQVTSISLVKCRPSSSRVITLKTFPFFFAENTFSRDFTFTVVQETPSSPEVQVLEDSQVAHSSPLAIQEDDAKEKSTPSVGLPFDFHSDLKVQEGGALPWVPWESLKDVPLVKGNTMLDINLGLHLILGACPLVDRAPIGISGGALDNLVHQELTLYYQVFLHTSLSLKKYSKLFY